MQPAPVALFVYNRPEHTRHTLEALRQNDLAPETHLYVFSDGAKNAGAALAVAATRDVVRGARGFARISVLERESNWGLSRNIIEGVGAVVAEHGKVIVLEDDLLTARLFLRYMNAMLEAYTATKTVITIAGFQFPKDLFALPADYPYDVYFARRASSWGWATWADRWQEIDWEAPGYAAFRKDARARRAFALGGDDLPDMLDRQMAGKINSWAIRLCFHQFQRAQLSVYPTRSFIDNRGFDGSGTHVSDKARQSQNLLDEVGLPEKLPAEVKLDPEMDRAFRQYYRFPVGERAKNTLKRYLRYESWMHRLKRN